MSEQNQIRKLTAGDVFTVVDMLKKVANDTLPKIIKSVSEVSSKDEKGAQGHQIQLGVLILTELYANLREDLITWLASMVYMEREEFLKSDAVLTLDIIEKLSTDKEYNGFFLRAYNLYKKIAG